MHKKSSLLCLINIIFIGMMTKIISMCSRIILSRSVGIEAVSVYSLVNPIFVFLITLSSFSLPTAISALVSRHPDKGKKIFLTSSILLVLINIPILLFILFFDKIIANNLLHNIETIHSIRLLLIVVPLTSISALIKGYYLGKKEMILTSTSSLIEECSRLISVILLTNVFLNLDNGLKATSFIIVMIIGEIVQTTYLILSSSKKYIKNIKKMKDVLDKENHIFSDVLEISFPLTLSRLITSFTYMLEPIILTTVLINLGMDAQDISIDYGIISSYVMPLLMMPSFFSLSISNYLLPNISSLIGANKFKDAHILFHRILLITFIIGIFISIIFFLFGGDLLKLIYNVDLGKNEIKVLSIPFVIYYIEGPINITMHALNLSKHAFKSSIICSATRIIMMVLLLNKFGVIAATYGTLISCFLDVIINYLTIVNTFKRNYVNSIH